MVANVLIAIAEQDFNTSTEASLRYQRIVENVKRTYKEKLLKNGREDIAVGRVDFVSTRSEAETYLSKGMYDIFLSTDRLTGDKDNIGIGTIRQWKEKFPNVNTYLLIEPKRNKDTGRLMNSGKLANLYLEGYYVALFVNEISANEEEFFSVLVNGRTKEEAYRYYELDDEIVGKILETKIKKPAAEIKKKEPVTEEWTKQNIFDSGTVPKEQETEVPEDAIDIDEIQTIKEPTYREESYTPSLYLDLDTLNAKATYSFDGIIGEIITDEVMIINCPGGGLIRNKNCLKGREIEIIFKDL